MSYERFKTPFFEVEMGPSTAKKKDLIKLPYQIKRLIEKVEIREFFQAGCTAGQFSLVFNEGSREPFSVKDPIDTSSAYPLNSNGSGFLTNRPGMLADLNYIAQGGALSLNAILPNETGIIPDDLPSVEDVFGNLIDNFGESSSTSPELTIEDKTKNTKSGIKYLFQQRNKVKITWGYLEDYENRRSVIGAIAAVEFDYPETDNPRVTVTCADLGVFFDQVSGIFGASFYDKLPVGISTLGKPIFNIQDLTLTEFIEQFASKANMGKPLISSTFDEIILDKYAVKTIPAGMSPNQYFQELANKYNAYYKATFDPSSGDEIIVFLSKDEYNKSLYLNEPNFMKYKQPGSIIKSLQLKAEFNALNGNAQTGVTADGKIIGVATNSPVTVGMIGSQAGIIDTDPTASNPVSSAQGAVKALGTAIPIGTSTYTAESENKEGLKTQAASKSYCQMNNTVMITLNTLGYAKLRPGPIKIEGIGKRFSGTFYFWEVHHILDNTNGYVCTLAGSNQSDYGGKTKPPEGFTKTKEDDEQVTVGQVDAILNPNTGSTAAEKYNKQQETN